MTNCGAAIGAFSTVKMFEFALRLSILIARGTREHNRANWLQLCAATGTCNAADRNCNIRV